MLYDRDKVNDYYQVMEQYDNQFILDIFCDRIPTNCSVLELGFGTGKDYLYLGD